MPWFREPPLEQQRTPLTMNEVPALILRALEDHCFFRSHDLLLGWSYGCLEECSWEVLRGRLLDPAHTRERRTFTCWNLHTLENGVASGEPVLSLKLDPIGGLLHVVRGLECHVWEGYDSGGGVILSRETRKWVRELVGTIRLAEFTTCEELLDEIICQLFHAVVGVSRLPLTSVEAPLPAFSFGRLAYCFGREPTDPEYDLGWRGLLATVVANEPLSRHERAKHLHTLLLTTPVEHLHELAALFPGGQVLPLLRTLFNEVSLTPYTHLVERVLQLLRALEERGVLSFEALTDFLGWLLRQLGRHLTAYDLVTFHHRGANYPDALLLDTVLKEYLLRIERSPDSFRRSAGDPDTEQGKQLRRRALRQAYLLRRFYEGHLVPEAPTSPGENMRVLPPSHPRVPEEQITNPIRRPRRLYDGDPLDPLLGPNAREVLRQSLEDLDQTSELGELGAALFLDRPFSHGKAPGEPDQTLLLACEAFSAAIARRRLNWLADHDLLDSASVTRLRGCLEVLPPRGVPLEDLPRIARPGSVVLTDAWQSATDFLFLRSTSASVRHLFATFDFAPLWQQFRLDDIVPLHSLLIFNATKDETPRVAICDAQGRRRVELAFDPSAGYRRRAGQETPARGLQVEKVWERCVDGNLSEIALRTTSLQLPPAG
jgi:hypothetical protein